MKITFIIFFGIYIIFLITLVLFDGYFGRSGFGNIRDWSITDFVCHARATVNIIPFKTIYGFISGFVSGDVSFKSFVVNLLGNLCAFAPFGFFLPLLFKWIKNTNRFLLCVSGMVISAELLQLLLLTGSCDIDDLILNIIGAYIVYVFLKIPCVHTLYKDIVREDSENQQQIQ